MHHQRQCWIMLNAHTGSEGNAVLPLEMINEGYKASSPGMMIADVRFKGGLYVELNHTNQHVEYIYVNTIATSNYEAFCGMAYDVPARSDPSAQLIINPGTCSPVPGRQKQTQCMSTRSSVTTATSCCTSCWFDADALFPTRV